MLAPSKVAAFRLGYLIGDVERLSLTQNGARRALRASRLPDDDSHATCCEEGNTDGIARDRYRLDRLA